MEKGDKDPFWIYKVKEKHHAHKFDKKYLKYIMYLIENGETNVNP